MTIWNWPFDSIPEMRSFRLRPFNISAIASQTQELIAGGLMVQRFEAKLTMPTMEEERWRDHDGLFAALRGVEGRLRLWDHSRERPLYDESVQEAGATWSGGGSWSGGGLWSSGLLPPFVTVAEGVARGSNYLRLKGFPASLNGVLRRGDLMEIRPNGIPAEHGHLYVVTRWAKSNSDGECGVYFEAGLRKGVRTGDMVVIGGGGMKPSSVFRLASDDEGSIDVQGTMVGSFGVSLIEVLPQS